jgi:hypothetical protein
MKMNDIRGFSSDWDRKCASAAKAHLLPKITWEEWRDTPISRASYLAPPFKFNKTTVMTDQRTIMSTQIQTGFIVTSSV